MSASYELDEFEDRTFEAPARQQSARWETEGSFTFGEAAEHEVAAPGEQTEHAHDRGSGNGAGEVIGEGAPVPAEMSAGAAETESLESYEYAPMHESTESPPSLPELDPYLAIRPALSPEHANLTADELTMIFGRQPAIVTLNSLLGSSQLHQAALAALLGKAGRRAIRINGSRVPVPSYLRMLSRLCREAAEQHEGEVGQETEMAPDVAPMELQEVRGNCPGPVTRIVSGWGQYADRVDKLPASEKGKIDELADLIVTSFARQRCAPFRTVTIVGHADKDWHGPKTEMEVSFKRANAVAAALTEAVRVLWVARKMGPPPVGGVNWKTLAKGATRMIAPPFRPANRRVEIVLTAGGLPVPPPAPRDSFDGRVARFLDLLKMRRVDPDPTGKRTQRVRCILTKIMKPGILDVFVDGTASNQQIGKHFVGENLCSWQGNYDPPQLSEADLLKFLGTVSSILKGRGFAPTVSDEQILKRLSQIMFMINEGIVRVERYITLNNSDFGYTGDKTRGQRLASIFADHLNDENSIYSCFKDFHGGE
jgi:hypothetical protein